MYSVDSLDSLSSISCSYPLFLYTLRVGEFPILEPSERNKGAYLLLGNQSFKFHKIPIRHQQLDE